jgi:hypothetical protein
MKSLAHSVIIAGNARRGKGCIMAIVAEGIGGRRQNADADTQEEEPSQSQDGTVLERGVTTLRRAMTANAVEKMEEDTKENRIGSIGIFCHKACALHRVRGILCQSETF